MDLLYTGRFDGFCLVSSDSDFTLLAQRIRESGTAVYGFGERKTPRAFVAACDKFIYLENLALLQPAAPATTLAPAPAPHAAPELAGVLRSAAVAASDEDGWANLGAVGNIILRRRPDFDARSYGYAKLSDLMAATGLFDLDPRVPHDGKPAIIYVRARQPE